MVQGTEVAVRLDVAGIDPDHPLAEHAYDEFLEEADGIAGVVAEERGTPVAGEKGALTELVLVLMAPGAGSAVVNLIKLWLERDQKRSVEVAVTKPGEEPFTVRASGEKISLGLLEETVKAAVQGATGEGTTGQGPEDGTGQTGE